MSENHIFDTAIIGAGAAGIMTAICLRRQGKDVLLLDSKKRVGAKILMSGGTRCNLTNQTVLVSDYESETPRVLKNILSAYSPKDALELFDSIGIEVKTEPAGKYFPASNSAKDVLAAFLSELNRLRVNLQTEKKVKSISHQNDIFEISGDDFSFHTKTIVLTTGGLSFPGTGSDGSGFGLAAGFGHHQIQTSPSLTPLETNDSDLRSLSGIALPVRITFWFNGKKEKTFEGPLLFTFFGFSGPAALNISRYWIRRPKTGKSSVEADFFPDETIETLRSAINQARDKTPTQTFKNFLSALLPNRFVEVILDKHSISSEVTLAQLTKTDREETVRTLKHMVLSITGDKGYEKAEVTAGGIDLKELNPKTLESKKQAGLFFAGEILDVDGRIGGFNFQWAWSSGHAAALGVVSRLKRR